MTRPIYRWRSRRGLHKTWSEWGLIIKEQLKDYGIHRVGFVTRDMERAKKRVEFLADRDCGLHHICFRVEDYDRWLEYFRTAGARIVYESVTENENIGYRRCFYAKDDVLQCYYEILEKPYFRK